MKRLFMAIVLTTAANAQPSRACATWASFPDADNGTKLGSFTEVSALPTGEAWAAGYGPDIKAMIQRFNGTSWQLDFHGNMESLRSVKAFSATDVWAVGGANTEVVLHYNGASWTSVPFTAPFNSPFINKVSGTSASDVWVVGSDLNSSVVTPMFAHFDGSNWTKAPSAPVASGSIEAILAFTPTNAWAAGTQGAGQPLLEHWDGFEWTAVALPPTAESNVTIKAITASGPDDIWLAGNFITSPNPPNILLFHYDGSIWTRVPPAGTSSIGREVYGISAVSANNVWLVGDLVTLTEGSDPLVLQNWTGANWLSHPSRRTIANSNSLTGIAMLPSGEGWAVGFDQPVLGQIYPLIRHYVPCR